MLVIGILLCLFVVYRSFCCLIDWVLDVLILVSKTDLLEGVCVLLRMIDELCVK